MVGLEENITKFYVTNWEGRVGLNPNMYNVTLFSLFFLKASLIRTSTLILHFYISFTLSFDAGVRGGGLSNFILSQSRYIQT